METDTPPWASPAVGGEKVGTAASHEQWGPPCTRQGEAERVKRSHHEPASEPVTAPHPPTWATVTGIAHARSQGPEEAACGWGHTGPHRSPRQGHALVFRGTAALAMATVSGRSQGQPVTVPTTDESVMTSNQNFKEQSWPVGAVEPAWNTLSWWAHDTTRLSKPGEGTTSS